MTEHARELEPEKRLEVKPQYVLRNGNSYFKQWTQIGPMCTSNPAEAFLFESKDAAVIASTRHYGLMLYNPEKQP